MDEWEVRVTDEWLAWFQTVDRQSQAMIVAAIDRLAEFGPNLGRPLVDRVKGGTLHSLKELRPGASGRSVIRILFIFDPWRSVALLVGGDKSGDWRGWYQRAVPGSGAVVRGVPDGATRRGDVTMVGSAKWSDVRPQLVAEVGGEEVVAEARQRQQAYIDAHRLAERRGAIGLTQAEVAERMGVTKGRVSQIERGEVSTVDVMARYVQALGGHLQIAAVFGDDSYVLHGTGATAA